LKRAANASYLLGIVSLVGIVVALFLVFAVFFLALSGATSSLAPLTGLTGFLGSIPFMILLIVEYAVMVPITLFFCYSTYKVGKYYSLTSLRLVAIVYAASIAVSPIEYLLVLPASSSLAANPASSYYMLTYLILVELPIIVVGLALYVSMIMGLSGLKTRTRIADFGTAEVLWIIGIALIVTLPIALIFYGGGLKKLATQQEAQMAARAIPEQGFMYCPQCGAKVELGYLFCRSCGFNLKKEA
jgi:hypothetical protein